MKFLRSFSDRLLQFVSLVVWAACCVQGTAFAAALLLTLAMPGLRSPSAWAAPVWRASLSLGAIFVIGGGLLFFLRGRTLAAGPAVPAVAKRPVRDLLLGGSLLALSVAALLTSADLLALWREALVLLDRAGAWRELSRGGPGSGLMLFPLIAILYTPALTGFAALCLITLPVVLSMALAARSPRLGRLFTIVVICCGVLVAASLVATDLFHHLAVLSGPALRRRSDPEMVEIVAGWSRAAEVLVRSARMQALILLGHLAWLPLVVRQESRNEVERAPIARPAPLARAALAIGCFMLLISAIDLLRPQARWAASDPEPGATLSAVPRSVSVTFGRNLAAESSLEVIQTLAGSLNPEEPAPGAGPVALNPRVDPGESRTLRTELAPGSGEGLYWVRWRAVSTGWGVPRRGSFAFRVGTSIPEHHLGERGRPSRETAENQRRRSSILLGGAFLVLLGLAMPRLAPSTLVH